MWIVDSCCCLCHTKLVGQKENNCLLSLHLFLHLFSGRTLLDVLVFQDPYLVLYCFQFRYSVRSVFESPYFILTYDACSKDSLKRALGYCYASADVSVNFFYCILPCCSLFLVWFVWVILHMVNGGAWCWTCKWRHRKKIILFYIPQWGHLYKCMSVPVTCDKWYLPPWLLWCGSGSLKQKHSTFMSIIT